MKLVGLHIINGNIRESFALTMPPLPLRTR
jgi:hypothetical protein